MKSFPEGKEAETTTPMQEVVFQVINLWVTTVVNKLQCKFLAQYSTSSV
jgi:hypothetical protein